MKFLSKELGVVGMEKSFELKLSALSLLLLYFNFYFSSSVPVPAQCGISRIWVLQQYRRKKIATRILDCVRCGACSNGRVDDGGGGDLGMVWVFVVIWGWWGVFVVKSVILG